MKIEIDEKNLQQGLLSLVVTLIEVIRDTLKAQAVKRMQGGSLEDRQIERLGSALLELDKAIEKLKEEQGILEAVRSLRESLDDFADRALLGLDTENIQEDDEGKDKAIGITL